MTMTDTNRRHFLRKASSGAVAVGAVATAPVLLLYVPGLVVVQRGLPLRGGEGFLDGPTVCGPVSASAARLRRKNSVLVALCWTGVLAPSSRNPLPRRGGLRQRGLHDTGRAYGLNGSSAPRRSRTPATTTQRTSTAAVAVELPDPLDPQVRILVRAVGHQGGIRAELAARRGAPLTGAADTVSRLRTVPDGVTT